MDHEAIRQRTHEEDTVLGTRTTAFLLGNSFLLTTQTSGGTSQDSPLLAVFGLLIAVLWLLTTIQSFRVIQVLHRLRSRCAEADPINAACASATFWKPGPFSSLLGPTALIAIWLPTLVLALWVVINFLHHFRV